MCLTHFAAMHINYYNQKRAKMFFLLPPARNRTKFQDTHDRLCQFDTFILISVLNVLLFVEATLEVVILDDYIFNLVEEEAVMVPVERFEILVGNYLVVAEFQSVDRLSIYDGSVECLEDIILDDYTLAITTVEVLCLLLEVGNYRVD